MFKIADIDKAKIERKKHRGRSKPKQDQRHFNRVTRRIGKAKMKLVIIFKLA